MDPFLFWLEATRLSTWIRESTSIFAFPGILSAHAIGMGLAAGINAAFAFHVLGWVPLDPARELRGLIPIMWFGFWLNAASGVLLLIAYPTKALTNPVFYLKLTFIAVAMGLYVVIRRSLFGGAGSEGPGLRSHGEGPGLRSAEGSGLREKGRLRLAGGAALFCWAGAITAGRLLAYTYSRLFASW